MEKIIKSQSVRVRVRVRPARFDTSPAPRKTKFKELTFVLASLLVPRRG